MVEVFPITAGRGEVPICNNRLKSHAVGLYDQHAGVEAGAAASSTKVVNSRNVGQVEHVFDVSQDQRVRVNHDHLLINSEAEHRKLVHRDVPPRPLVRIPIKAPIGNHDEPDWKNTCQSLGNFVGKGREAGDDEWILCGAIGVHVSHAPAHEEGKKCVKGRRALRRKFKESDDRPSRVFNR